MDRPKRFLRMRSSSKGSSNNPRAHQDRTQVTITSSTQGSFSSLKRKFLKQREMAGSTFSTSEFGPISHQIPKGAEDLKPSKSESSIGCPYETIGCPFEAIGCPFEAIDALYAQSGWSPLEAQATVYGMPRRFRRSFAPVHAAVDGSSSQPGPSSLVPNAAIHNMRPQAGSTCPFEQVLDDDLPPKEGRRSPQKEPAQPFARRNAVSYEQWSDMYYPDGKRLEKPQIKFQQKHFTPNYTLNQPENHGQCSTISPHPSPRTSVDWETFPHPYISEELSVFQRFLAWIQAHLRSRKRGFNKQFRMEVPTFNG
ncbi:hypothetical protein QBC35DRAFT_472129 [Podospora australis]|uniref:Uncharacterized protein n=1 Tax=Podospora australis TaxID=1536484 RepID=A0AAN6WXM2_9PEZI|nr:hypothetical protein QBC35DRAFT_472129 [Podospora australis]